MRPTLIRKSAADLRVPPNLFDYEAERASFSWEKVRREIAGLPGGGLNIGFETSDRHLSGPNADRVALRFLCRGGGERPVTYRELSRLSNRFANILRALGVGRGDRVFVLAGRIPELYVAVIGALKNGSVVSPLFSAFGPEPIRQRLAGCVTVVPEIAASRLGYRACVMGTIVNLLYHTTDFYVVRKLS